MLRLAIQGAAGRMGQALIRCADRFDDLNVTVALEPPGHAALGQDPGALAGRGPLEIQITDDPAAISDADVVVDFTFHTAVRTNIPEADRQGKMYILGTTGLDPEETALVHDAATRIPIVWAPNMSLGMNVLFALVKQAAAALGIDYDAEIVETHHRHKQDAPSGTALALARYLTEGREQELEQVACYGREGIVGERPRGEVGIHAVRGGDIVGDHVVMLSTDGERLELTHRASSRDAFAMGALRATRWLDDRAPGMYDMHDVLGIKKALR